MVDLHGIRISGDVQHGERMETWALRTCLLIGVVSRAAELRAGMSEERERESVCLPHGYSLCLAMSGCGGGGGGVGVVSSGVSSES